jgi:hypothetical protein
MEERRGRHELGEFNESGECESAIEQFVKFGKFVAAS